MPTTTPDPYENIYTVVRGAKHFTLLPPTEGWSLGGESGHSGLVFLAHLGYRARVPTRDLGALSFGWSGDADVARCAPSAMVIRD
jgi:hypothetical protein